MTIYKNYFADWKETRQPAPRGEENDFFLDGCEDEVIDEIIGYDGHMEGSLCYSHTLIVYDNGEAEKVNWHERAMRRWQDDKEEARAEREHQESYSVELRN